MADTSGNRDRDTPPSVAPSGTSLSPLPPSMLARWLPPWATPPAYGHLQAAGLVSAATAGHPDHDAAFTVVDRSAADYGHTVALPGAPAAAVHDAGIWQLGAHLAATSVITQLRTGPEADDMLAELLTVMTGRIWPGWGQVTAPDPDRLHAGLAAHRHVSTSSRPLAPDTGVTALIRCATTTGAQLPAAQHRLIHHVTQRAHQVRGLHCVLYLASGA